MEDRRDPDPGPPPRLTRSGCSPGRWTTSPPGCPRSPARSWAWTPPTWCWTARRWPVPGRAAAAVPGHREPGRHPTDPGHRGGDARPAAHPVLLRPAAPGRHRPDRRARRATGSPGSPRSPRPVWSSRGSSPPRWRRPRRSSPTPWPGATRASWSSRWATATPPGRRGSEWIKVKPRHTLDLVVLAAEWGHGRRRGWLSNLHLGARDPDTGGMVMLGKTFKGLTDEMLAWQTSRLLELADPPVASRGAGRLGRGPGPARAGRGDRLRRGPGQPAATRAGWRCGSPACCATARTRPPPRRTRSARYAPCGTARTTRGANREKCLAGRERGLADHPARPADPGRPADQQGHRVLRGRARRAGHHRADPAGPHDAGRAGRQDPHASTTGSPPTWARTCCSPNCATATRCCTTDVLTQHLRGDAADRLHPHGGPGHPAVQPGVPAAPRRVPVRATTPR